MSIHLRDDKFIISCAARTGSTMLQQMLDSHPDVVCHGEIVARGRVGLLVGRYLSLRYRHPEVEPRLAELLESRPETFLYDILFDAQGHRSVGFKFKTDEALSGKTPFAAYQELVVRDTDIKVIRLVRRNLLEQFVSHEVANATGVTYVRDGASAPVVEPFRIKPDRAVSFIRGVLERERQADTAYRDHRQIQVTYEDLVADAEAIQGQVLSFLGVGIQPLTVSTRKILTDSTSLVVNLDEVVAALAERGLDVVAAAAR